MRWISASSLAFVVVLGGSRADADTIEACASASEHGQSLRNDRKWHAAREEFLACAQARCPEIVRTDCEQWLGELDRAMPTVIVSAKDDRGSDLLDVRLLVDGELLAERADGRAVSLDPGPHQLRYEHAGSPPILDSIVAREAEKDRRLSVHFVTPRAERSDRITTPRAHRPLLAYALGAAGVVSLGAFVYLDVNGQSQYDHCKDARTCTPSDLDALDTKRYVTWGMLGAGIALAGVGGFLLWRDRQSASGVRVGVIVSPDRAAAILRAEF